MTKINHPAILILHFRNNQYTLPCLDSLALLRQPTPIYILSIQSTDADSLRRHSVKPIVQETQQNGGFAWANNELAKMAFRDGCDSIILLNNDTTVDPDFVAPLVKQLGDPRVGMVCPKIYFYPGCEFHLQAYKKSELGKVIWYAGGVIDWANVFTSHWGVDEVDHGQFDQVVETDFATGCCVALTKKTVEAVGFINEQYFLYYEDADWSMEIKKAGLKIIVEPASIVFHKNAGSTGGSGSPLQQYYQTRNRIYFGLKYAPLKTKLHLIKNAILGLTSPQSAIRRANFHGLIGRMGIQ